MSYWPLLDDPTPVLFVHIPKTAGISIQKWYRSRYKKFQKCMHGGVENPAIATKLEQMPSFTVVRNPWDLVYSWYRYKRQMLEEKSHWDANERRVWAKGFNPWMEQYFTKVNWTKDKATGGRNPMSPSFSHLKYIGSTDRITEILRFENLDREWAKVKKLANTDLELGYENKTQVVPVSRKRIYSHDSRLMVEKAFSDDLKVWDWSF